jgi:hypothetical protein
LAQIKWGSKRDRQENICGDSFDWTQDEERITLQNWECRLAVELPDDEKRATDLGMEYDHGHWSVYFDEYGDGGLLIPGRGSTALEVTIKRTAANS